MVGIAGPSMYEKLMNKLGSSNKSTSKRRREVSSEDDIDQKEDDYVMRKCNAYKDHANVMGTLSQDVDVPDDNLNITDDYDLENDVQDSIDSSGSKSYFRRHVEHSLSEAEINDITQGKRKFSSWEVSAFGKSSAKWVGSGECFLKDDNEDCEFGLKPQLYRHWQDIYKGSEYRDVLHADKKPFYLKGAADSSIMDAYLMHSLNHVFRSRDQVIKNSAKLAKLSESGAAAAAISATLLDQGFTRPKVLILLPFRSIALRVVKRLIELTPPSLRLNYHKSTDLCLQPQQATVEYKDRFFEEFGTTEDEDETKNVHAEKGDTENDFIYHRRSKPVDHQTLFGGNSDDHFRVGIKFTRKSIKMYSDFYSSDIIIASPIGLVTKIEEATKMNEKDFDFLSSIEVLIIDHADVIAMQNWEHVNFVFKQVNQIPSKQHGTDIMRIRKWYLDGHAQFYRQTILLGFFITPDMNALFNNLCVNYHGKVKLVREYKGNLAKVLFEVRQVYERLDTTSILEEDDARFDYFVQKVFPKIKDSLQGGVMIFTSTYFEFVRIRNFLKSQKASFCMLGEYTQESDKSRSRLWFFEGKRKIMLYTERAHFYFRYKIRGVKNLIIYSLPERKEFYPEIVNNLGEADSGSCTVLFSRFDSYKLKRIVGTTASKKMISSTKNTFVFC